MCWIKCSAKHNKSQKNTRNYKQKSIYLKPVYYYTLLIFFSFFFLSVPQSPLPAPLSARRSLLRSPLRSCPLLAKTENAPSASTRRWTRSSTPAATCACATTAGWSSRGRSTRAVPSAGGPSRTSSRRIGRDGAAHEQVLRLARGGLLHLRTGWTWKSIWRWAKLRHNGAYFFFFFFRICFLEVEKKMKKDTPVVVQRLQTQAHLFWQEK